MNPETPRRHEELQGRQGLISFDAKGRHQIGGHLKGTNRITYVTTVNP
jgi:hypothetical protein